MDEFFDRIIPYNLWNGNTLPTGYERKDYVDRLMSFSGNNLIKVITGQRRVGKSFIMRQIAMRWIEKGVNVNNILFINRELADFNFLSTYEDFLSLIKTYRKRLQPQGKFYVFVDEVQDIEEWERGINSLSQDYTIDCELYITGSNSRLLSGELATLLSGRYLEMEVFPFSFEEYSGVKSLYPTRDAYLSYLKDGGLPELFNLPTTEVKQQYLAGLRDSIMLKDIVKRYSIKDIALLENLFGFLVNNSSSIISISGIVKYIKGRGGTSTYDTVAAYISYLQEAFLVHKSEKYNISGKELLGGNFKVYINDQSYHNYLFRLARFGSGYLLEGAVYLELLRKGYKVYTGINGKLEVDFVATNETRTLYIQVAYMVADEETANREYRSLENVKGEGEKYLVTVDDEEFPVRSGVRHVRAWQLSQIL